MCCNDGDGVDEDKIILCCACCCAHFGVYTGCDCPGCSGKIGLCCLNCEICCKPGKLQEILKLCRRDIYLVFPTNFCAFALLLFVSRCRDCFPTSASHCRPRYYSDRLMILQVHHVCHVVVVVRIVNAMDVRSSKYNCKHFVWPLRLRSHVMKKSHRSLLF